MKSYLITAAIAALVCIVLHKVPQTNGLMHAPAVQK